MIPPGRSGTHLALLRHWGRENEARRYLDALNRVQAAFGGEP